MKQYKVLLIPAAYNDLHDARDWYREINSELLKKLNHQVKITLERKFDLCPLHTP
jgi:hypothetical protein